MGKHIWQWVMDFFNYYARVLGRALYDTFKSTAAQIIGASVGVAILVVGWLSTAPEKRADLYLDTNLRAAAWVLGVLAGSVFVICLVLAPVKIHRGQVQEIGNLRTLQTSLEKRRIAARDKANFKNMQERTLAFFCDEGEHLLLESLSLTLDGLDDWLGRSYDWADDLRTTILTPLERISFRVGTGIHELHIPTDGGLCVRHRIAVARLTRQLENLAKIGERRDAKS